MKNLGLVILVISVFSWNAAVATSEESAEIETISYLEYLERSPTCDGNEKWHRVIDAIQGSLVGLEIMGSVVSATGVYMTFPTGVLPAIFGAATVISGMEAFGRAVAREHAYREGLTCHAGYFGFDDALVFAASYYDVESDSLLAEMGRLVARSRNRGPSEITAYDVLRDALDAGLGNVLIDEFEALKQTVENLDGKENSY